MKLPLQIAFHNMVHDGEIEESIRTHAAWLEDYDDRIMSCRVVVGRPHRHHKDGNLCQIRIDLKVPGDELTVTRDPSRDGDFKSLDVLIHDAFDEMRRQLEDRVRLERGETKAHDPLQHALIKRVFRERGYGFLETPDSREIYFHMNSVLDANIEDLTVGTEVSFVEELGD